MVSRGGEELRVSQDFLVFLEEHLELISLEVAYKLFAAQNACLASIQFGKNLLQLPQLGALQFQFH